MIWLDSKGRGGWCICQGWCPPCHHRSWFLHSNWFPYLHPIKVLAPIFHISSKNLHHIWVTCNTPSDGSHTKAGVEILSPLKIQQKVIVPMHQQWARGEKDLIIMCTRWWITHIFPLSCQQQYVLSISLTNDRDATPYTSQTAISLWSYYIFDLHLNHSLIASDDFLTQKSQGQNTFQLNLKVLPFLACHALQFSVSLFKVKMKIGAWSICIWTKRGKQIMNVQNVISITLPLFFY